jgi:hypothetical protein
MSVELRAHQTGKLGKRRVYRVPVRVLLNDSRLCRTVAEDRHVVLAHDTKAAAEYVRDLYAERPETEIIAYGPFGGETRRFISWQSAIWSQMSTARSWQVQPPLPFAAEITSCAE